MVDKYESLRKSTTDFYKGEISQVNTFADEEIGGIKSAFATGEASVSSPYVKNLIGEVNIQREEGVRLLQDSLSDELDDIRRQRTQSYIDNILDIVKIGVSFATGGSIAAGAVAAADLATKEIRKTNPEAPEQKAVIPYGQIIKETLPALNAASNILNRTNYRYTQLKRGENR